MHSYLLEKHVAQELSQSASGTRKKIQVISIEKKSQKINDRKENQLKKILTVANRAASVAPINAVKASRTIVHTRVVGQKPVIARAACRTRRKRGAITIQTARCAICRNKKQRNKKQETRDNAKIKGEQAQYVLTSQTVTGAVAGCTHRIARCINKKSISIWTCAIRTLPKEKKKRQNKKKNCIKSIVTYVRKLRPKH